MKKSLQLPDTFYPSLPEFSHYSGSQGGCANNMDIVYVLWLRAMKQVFRSRSRILMSVIVPFAVLLLLGVGLNGDGDTAGHCPGLHPVFNPGHGCDDRYVYRPWVWHPDPLGQAVWVSQGGARCPGLAHGDRARSDCPGERQRRSSRASCSSSRRSS